MFPIANGVPLRYPPVITWALIAVNCTVFLFQLSLSPSELDALVDRFALIPARYFDAGSFDSAMSPTDYLPFVSNMFLHGGWLHLIINMWTLWLFGRVVEDQLGSLRYLAFYFACGLLASIGSNHIQTKDGPKQKLSPDQKSRPDYGRFGNTHNIMPNK